MSLNPFAQRRIFISKRRFPKKVNDLPKAIKRISFTYFIYMFGWGLVTPYIGIYFKELIGNYTLLGIMFFVFCFGSTLVSLPYGVFINDVSKTKMLRVIFLMYSLFAPWFLFLHGIVDVTLIRFVHGIMAAGTWTTGEAYIREYSPKHKTAGAMGFFDSSFSLGMTLGCFAGGALIGIMGYNLFLLVSVFSFLTFLTTFYLPDKKRKFNFKKGLKSVVKTNLIKASFSDLTENSAIAKLSLLSFLRMFVTAILGLLLPLFLFEISDNLFLIGLIVGAGYLPRIFESYFSNVADNNSKRMMIIMGSSYSIAFFILFFFIDSIVVMFILSFFISLAGAMIEPSIAGAITTELPRKKLGEMSGVLHMVKMMGQAIGPLIAGFISDLFGIRYVFILGAIVMIAVLGISFTIKEYRSE